MLSTGKSQLSDTRDVRFWDDQGLLWTGFAFAAGIALYSGLPDEPSWLVLSILFGLVFVLAMTSARGRPYGKSLVLAVACLGGVTTGAVRTAYVEAPRLGEQMNVDLTGMVLQRLDRASGRRLILEVITVDGRSINELVFPGKIRLRVPVEPNVSVGEFVKVRARLFPPAGPVVPGGYDFSFRAFFDQIGASGFSFGPVTVIKGEQPPLSVRAAAQVQRLREAIKARIGTVLGEGGERALAVALLVGDRSAIEEKHETDLRAAGLAHILAISGLHMALFAGGTYGLVLLTLAVFPSLPVRWPTHKWAAAAALAAAVFYLLLSGASVATQRSFLMIGLVFVGILTGRRGLTLRSVALAGLFLLLLAPERLFQPGFQMSFAAVICLIAVYELWRRRQKVPKDRRKEDVSVPVRLMQVVGRWSVGLFVTALVAGVATGIIGAHQFGRIAPFGLVGNLLGMPVFSLVVMPMGVLSLVLMPFGLAALPLTVMSIGLSWILEIAAFTAELGAGAGSVGKLSAVGALLFMAALFTILLLPGRWRFSAILPFIAGLVVVGLQKPPDIQLAASGNRVAARDVDSTLKWSGRRRSFASDVWLVDEGIPESAILSHKMQSRQKSCDPDGCVVRAYAAGNDDPYSSVTVEALSIALPRTVEALLLDCQYADIVVSDLNIREACPVDLVIDKEVRKKRGAISIWLSDVEPRATASIPGHTTDGSAILAVNPKVSRIRYAIPEPPRPWHRTGAVTRASLRQKRNVD
ncbi:MAG: ComEC family competence protein [Roseibium sp.]|nr:ComEC family competence protein [Roseibium sp.]